MQDIDLEPVYFRYPYRIEIRDSLAVILDLHNDSHYLYAFTYPDWQPIAPFGRRGEGPEELLRELWKFQRLKLSGVVWFDNSACMGKVLQHLAGQHFPIVCVDNPPQHVDVPYVGVDNFGGMYAAATALLKTFRDGISYFGRELTLESRMRRTAWRTSAVRWI